MKHFIVIFFALTMSTSMSFAEEKKIETNKALWHEEIRSTFCIFYYNMEIV